MMSSDTIEWKGQAFTILGTREYTNRHGYPAPLVVLETACKQCGTRMQVTVRQTKRLRLDRCRKRCLECSPRRQGERILRPVEVRTYREINCAPTAQTKVRSC